MDICIVDLDGVVAEITLRLQKAKAAKEEYLENVKFHPVIVEKFDREKQATDLYWKTVFDPALVEMDTLIAGSFEALCEIEKHYRIIFLSSRPESMREATIEWLKKYNVFFNHTVHGERHLILKPPAFQFTKTPVWKAGMVQTLGLLFDSKIVKFVDDEKANWNELLQHTPYVHYSLEWIKSLKEATEHLKEDEELKKEIGSFE